MLLQNYSIFYSELFKILKQYIWTLEHFHQSIAHSTKLLHFFHLFWTSSKRQPKRKNSQYVLVAPPFLLVAYFLSGSILIGCVLLKLWIFPIWRWTIIRLLNLNSCKGKCFWLHGCYFFFFFFFVNRFICFDFFIFSKLQLVLDSFGRRNRILACQLPNEFPALFRVLPSQI